MGLFSQYSEIASSVQHIDGEHFRIHYIGEEKLIKFYFSHKYTGLKKKNPKRKRKRKRSDEEPAAVRAEFSLW